MRRQNIVLIACLMLLLPITGTQTGGVKIDFVTYTPFISTWNTNLVSVGSSAANQVTLPLRSGYTYSFDVNWGDGSTDTITSYDQAEVTHTYAAEGIYTIQLTGVIGGWLFNNAGDKLKIIEISQWGDIQFGTGGNYFSGCDNLVLTATDSPVFSNTDTLYGMFENCLNLGDQGDLSSWDTSGIIDMSSMFAGAESFNMSIEAWDVSNVEYMIDMFREASSYNQPLSTWDTTNLKRTYKMFEGASSFNQPIGTWNMSQVYDTSHMFEDAVIFNQDISNWDVSSVNNMAVMFSGALAFNQSLVSWDVSAVTSMNSMFEDADSFNQPIGSWNTSSVTNMMYMFRSNDAFNQDLNGWDTSSVTTMMGMFFEATAFNGAMDSWDTSSVITMAHMFGSARSFNQPIGSWNTSQVTSMTNMFLNAVSFNQSVGDWDVGKVTIMNYMFDNATDFNQPLNDWDVSSVTQMGSMFHDAVSFNQELNDWNTSQVTTMYAMFQDAIFFNQDLSGWNTSKVTNLSVMFKGALAFDQSLGAWDIESVTSISSMFEDNDDDPDLSVDNYDATLNGWAVQEVKTGLSFTAGNSRYSTAGAAARAILMDDYNWVIYDDGFYEEDAPSISSPADIELIEGYTAIIAWEVSDFQPGTYNITVDGGVIDSGDWTNGTISITHDNDTISSFEYILTVWDELGNMASDTVVVTVVYETTPPDISHPDDFTINVGGTILIEWTVGDKHPGTYNISLPCVGDTIQRGDWTNGTIDIAPVCNTAGIYTVVINVYDSRGNHASDSVTVTVEDPSTTETSDEPTSSETTLETTLGPTESDPVDSFVGFNWMAMLSSVAVITIIRRKNK
ncbi:MAG: BspA family leucine-rich repeat surface protein [Candidatus Heimdallarchaeota archaeon]|nr:BspA family leucine-rich repeat surface protein [Candidatus Heimdallarchaeota archaeon]